MSQKAPFLREPYAAYHHRQLPGEDVELTHVGPGTPGGEYLRRFWQPVAYLHELTDVALPLRLMGEDLVAFRDGRGRVGLLERHCSHRGTSLEFGRPEPEGLRCCYHGWLFATDGRILETPTEPAGSTLKDRLCHGAYPTHEHRGVIFAYLGPPDRRPPFPRYDFFDFPGQRLVPLDRAILPSNWLQIKENAMDPFHTVFLHTLISGSQFGGDWRAIYPVLEWAETPLGMVSVATRRADDLVRIRMNDIVLPNIHQFSRDSGPQDVDSGQATLPLETKWAVPVDDRTTLLIRLLHVDERTLEGRSPEQQDEIIRTLAAKANFGEEADRPYEVRQRAPADYDAQVSQRPIAIHALEHLGVTDRGVIAYRKLLRRGIQDVREGRDPQGLCRTSAEGIPTYSQARLIRSEPAPTPETDRTYLHQLGRWAAAAPARAFGAPPPWTPEPPGVPRPPEKETLP